MGNKISLEEFATPTRRLEPKHYMQVSSMGEKTSTKNLLPVFKSWAEANFLHTHVLQVQQQRIGTQKHTILRGWDCVCNLSAGFNFPKSDESWVVGNGLTNQLGTLGFSLQCATLHNRISELNLTIRYQNSCYLHRNWHQQYTIYRNQHVQGS